jgi:hypothetical protein
MGPEPTREALDQALAGLVRDQRQWIARDPVRVRSLLHYQFPDSAVAQSRDAEAAVLAIQLGVFDLLEAPDPAAVERLEARMTEGGATPDEARWALWSWASAAGVSLPWPESAPPPAAPPAPSGFAPPTTPTTPTTPAATTQFAAPGAVAAGGGFGAGASGGPYAGPTGAGPPGSSGGGAGSRTGLVVGLVVLVVVLLLVGGLGFALSRRSEVAQDPATVPTTSAPATTAAPPTSGDDTTTSRRSTTTRRPTTTDESSTTDASPTTPPPWTTFDDPAGKYSIDFPRTPNLSTSTTDIDGQQIGIFDYSAVAKGIDYELAVAELPPGYSFTNPQSTLENVVGSAVNNQGGSVAARDDSPFAGNPALFLDIKRATDETNVFGLISGNRIYVMVVTGQDLTQADFPRFRGSFRIH